MLGGDSGWQEAGRREAGREKRERGGRENSEDEERKKKMRLNEKKKEGQNLKQSLIIRFIGREIWTSIENSS